MSTITREQLRESAREKVKSLEFSVKQTAFADSRSELEEELELARIALASLEAEAVAIIDQANLDYLKSGSDADVWPASRTEMGDVLLYRAAPPAPVKNTKLERKAAILDALYEKYNIESLDDFVEWKRNHIAELEAAPPAPVGKGETAVMPDYPGYVMTQRECYEAGKKAGLAELVTTAYKLPANTPCNDAPEHIWLQTAGVWPENGEFSELTWCSDNQHPDDTLYVRADVVAGNSPVIPDGWVACSERMPEIGIKVLCFPVNDEPIHATYNGQVWLQDISWSTSDEPIDNVISCNVFHWMPLPAAPQQEAE